MNQSMNFMENSGCRRGNYGLGEKVSAMRGKITPMSDNKIVKKGLPPYPMCIK